MAQVIEASGVLIRYILAKLLSATIAETKLLLPALKSLCEGRSQDKDFDHIILSSILRNAKYPEHLKAATAGKSMKKKVLDFRMLTLILGNEKDSSKAEMKRSRSDLSTVILQQLTTPMGLTTAGAWTPLSEELADCSVIFA